MRRPNIENIEIVEPPIEELSKNRSTFRSTCLTGCGCVLIFIIIIIAVIWIAIGRGPTTLKTIPDNFPANIPIYDRENIEKITYITGKYKSRGMEIAFFLPKIILSPLILQTTNDNPDNTISSSTSRFLYFKRILNLIRTPVGDKRNTIQITWSHLDAEPNFIINYYKKELRKAGFILQENYQNHKQFNFSNGNIDGMLSVQEKPDNQPGTNSVTLLVNLATSTAR